MFDASSHTAVRQYRDLFESQKLWQKMKWRGHECWKTPEDMWLYQEVISELRPATIIEFGTAMGGSALFFADILELNGCGRILSIDIEHRDGRPQHSRLTYLTAHSRDPETVPVVRRFIEESGGPVLMIEDSVHNCEQVVGELQWYADLVTPGSWFVVEDGGWPDEDQAIQQGIDDFLAGRLEFARDETKWKFNLTVAPNGWLRKRDG